MIEIKAAPYLLPQSGHEPRRYDFAAFGSGIALAVVIVVSRG